VTQAFDDRIVTRHRLATGKELLAGQDLRAESAILHRHLDLSHHAVFLFGFRDHRAAEGRNQADDDSKKWPQSVSESASVSQSLSLSDRFGMIALAGINTEASDHALFRLRLRPRCRPPFLHGAENPFLFGKDLYVSSTGDTDCGEAYPCFQTSPAFDSCCGTFR